MKIIKVEIASWRSVKHLVLDCQPLMVLLGPNNHGKSNVLSAIGFALSASEKPSADDFFVKREIKEDGPDELWVELTFDGLSEVEKSTFNKYVGADGRLRVRKTATLDLASSKVEVRYNGWLSQPRIEWLHENYKPKRPDLQDELKPYLPEGKYSQKAVTKAKEAYIAAHTDNLEFDYDLEKGPFLGAKTVAAGTLPEWFLIPAVRDLTDETKTKSTASFGRLLTRAVRDMTELDPSVREVRRNLEELVGHLNEGDNRPQQLTELESAIQEEMKGWDATLKIKVESPDISKVFELGTSLIVDDGVLTAADRKGNGMQRALMLALTQAWVAALRKTRESTAESKSRTGSNTVILAIEEPELFLHPHAERKLHRNLAELANEEQHQVILSTHSSHFVDLEHPRRISIIHKLTPETGTAVRQIKTELFSGDDVIERKKRFRAARWVNPVRGEMLFARRVAFVEGETEVALFPFLAEKLGCFDPDVSVIDCGSKNNLPLYIELAQAFSLNYVVVHDEDPVADMYIDSIEKLRKEDPVNHEKLDKAKNTLKSKRQTFALNEVILELVGDSKRVRVLAPDIEVLAGVPKRKGEKLGKPLAAIEHFEKDTIEIPNLLEEAVRAVYEQ